MTDETKKERFEFQSEARRVLDLMINSVYSDPDIFLRELISNASDALDKLRIESLSDPSLSDAAASPRISVTVDSGSRSISISDNGIGMSRDDLISYLGTVAKSGTGEFLGASEAGVDTESLIGRFGVGFYSAFIVASRAVVTTRRAGETDAWMWSSEGDGTYTIEPAEREEQGTTVQLFLKGASDDEESATKDYLSETVLRALIKKYSDFVSHPICVGSDSEPANSMKALWMRPEDEVEEGEYEEFYKRVSHDWEPPLERIVYRAEGTNEFRALLFIPSQPPFDLYFRDGARGVQLYIKRVFIMDDCREIVPEYLRFLRGVIDSEDLPLNISRELLQQDGQTAMIRRGVTRKVLDALRRMKDDDADKFAKFWAAFGTVLKEGVVQDARNRTAILKLCQFATTTHDRSTLEEYVSRMKDGQKDIYYISGAAAKTLKSSPKLEAFARAGIEVLLLSDPVDDFWAPSVGEFDGHDLTSVAADDVDLPAVESSEETKRAEESGAAQELLSAMSGLGGACESVSAVKFSPRLVTSPATLTSHGPGMTRQMRSMLEALGRETPPESLTLEINADHSLVKAILSSTAERADQAAALVALAQLSDGDPVDDAQRFTDIMTKLVER